MSETNINKVLNYPGLEIFYRGIAGKISETNDGLVSVNRLTQDFKSEIEEWQVKNFFS
jgi:hypothetical protein